jgi:hypothetical protein
VDLVLGEEDVDIAKLPPQSEKDFQKSVIDLARTLGWKVAHFRAARTKHGWATPVAADGAGFPDLCMLRRERIVFAELKRVGGKLRPEQEDWQHAVNISVAEHYVWTPNDTDEIVEALR